MSPPKCIKRRIVRTLPQLVLTDLWQTAFAVFWMSLGVGFSILLYQGLSGVVQQTLPNPILILFWCLMFLLGGLSQIIGMCKSWRATERLGIHLSALGCLVYGIVLMNAGSAPGVVVGVGFLLLTLFHWTALLISSVASEVAGT